MTERESEECPSTFLNWRCCCCSERDVSDVCVLCLPPNFHWTMEKTVRQCTVLNEEKLREKSNCTLIYWSSLVTSLSLSCGLDVFSLVFFFFPLLRLLRPICMSDRSANNTCSECELRGLVLICGATVTISKLESANRLPQRFASVDLNFSSSPAQCLSMLSLPLSYQFRQCALSVFYYRVK